MVTPRGLPPETVHLPFEAGPYRMAMGLTSVPDAAWFDIDALYPAEMAERDRLLRTHHPEVFAALPVSDAARQETLAAVADNLTRHHPAWFHCADGVLRNLLTGEDWDLAAPSCDPLELAGRLVQEDLCLLQIADGEPVFTAGVLCFPSRWRMDEKIGRPLAAVHGPVPLYGERLARPVDRFLRHVKPGHIAMRLNWSILDDPALFQREGKWRLSGDASITAANAGASLFLRVERQTLRLLPATGAILFGIRVHVYPLDRVVTEPEIAARLASAVRALPEDVAHYKSMLSFRTALLTWLDGRA